MSQRGVRLPDDQNSAIILWVLCSVSTILNLFKYEFFIWSYIWYCLLSIDHLLNIKGNVYIYHFNQQLTEEQKHTKESDNQNSMFDIIIKHQYTPTQTSRGIKI
jgi:hypothetical protein